MLKHLNANSKVKILGNRDSIYVLPFNYTVYTLMLSINK
jgi:hypothetical protein